MTVGEGQIQAETRFLRDGISSRREFTLQGRQLICRKGIPPEGAVPLINLGAIARVDWTSPLGISCGSPDGKVIRLGLYSRHRET